MTIPGHSVIHASAGTGKTYRLSSRYIELLKAGAGSESILATTFTRKAAGEILDRVFVRLAREDCDESLRLLASSLHRVSISTIDGHFNRIASAFRWELGLPPDLNYVDDRDPRAKELRDAAMENLLASNLLETIVDLVDKLSPAGSGFSTLTVFEIIGEKLYDVYRSAAHGTWGLRTEGALLDQSAVDAHLTRCKSLSATPTLLRAFDSSVEALGSGDALGFLTCGIPKCVVTGTFTYYKKEVPPDLIEAYEPLIAHAAFMVAETINRQTTATYNLLKAFDAHYTTLRKSRGVLLFSDLAERLQSCDFLAASDIQYRLDARFTHLLLDEFQDTSPIQWKVLKPLAEEICSQADRSFFCVGDIKQAIYGWRGGRATILRGLLDELNLEAHHLEYLAESYRSSPVIIDAVNRVFGTIDKNPALAEHPEIAGSWTRAFETHSASDQSLPGSIQTLTVDEEDELGVLERTVELIRTLPGDLSIGVLCLRNKTVATMTQMLIGAGIHASREGGSPIDGDPAVEIILSALTLGDHPGDSIAAFHVLNSPLAEPLGFGSMNDAETVSRRIRASILARGYSAVIAEWAQILAPHVAARYFRVLEELIGLAEQYPYARLRPSEFVDHVRKTSVKSPLSAGVRVMTVDSSKGLEFDVVVLPELERLMGDVKQNAVYISEGPPMRVVRSARKEIREILPELNEAYRDEVARRLSDDLCKFYVAMTRPRHALFMVMSAEPRGMCPANILRNALPEMEYGDPRWHEKVKREPVPEARIIRPVLKPGAVAAARVRASKTSVARYRKSSDRLRGKLFHAWFESIEWLPYSESALRSVAAREFEAGEKWLGEFLKALESFSDVFTRPAGEVVLWREKPFVVRDGDVTITGRFDRVHIEGNRATIYDFKTGGGDHEAQMTAYRRALSLMLRIPESSIATKILRC